jgi:hypothetical protein
MKRAVIKDGEVINIVHLPDDWTGETGEWQPPAETTLADIEAQIGDLYDGSVVTPVAVKLPEDTELEDRNEVDDNGDPIMEDGVQVVTPGLKSQWIARTKETQGSLLAQTDWAYIRKADTGIAVPAEIQTYRDEVRLAAGTIEGQIAACADLDAFRALFEVPTDADGNVTGNAPIHNWPARQF